MKRSMIMLIAVAFVVSLFALGASADLKLKPVHKIPTDQGSELPPKGQGTQTTLPPGTLELGPIQKAPVYKVCSYMKLSRAKDHSMALAPSGAVWTWKDLGAGNAEDFVPYQYTIFSAPNMPSGVKDILATNDMNFLIYSDGSVWFMPMKSGNWAKLQSTLQIASMAIMNGDKAIDLPIQNGSAFSAKAAVTTPTQELYLANASEDAWGNPGPLTTMKIKDGIQAIAAGKAHILALTADNQVLAFGKNDFGQLGIGVHDATVHSISNVTGINKSVWMIAAGANHSLALTNEGNVLAWGGNIYGQLGDGTTTDRDVPIQVIFPSNIKISAIIAGGDSSMAIDSEGQLWMWGSNCSVGSSACNKPVKVGGALLDAHVISAATDGKISIAADRNGKIWRWGNIGGVQQMLPQQMQTKEDLCTY